ncbi:MAG: Snf7 family protein [Candidatus Bathyarchaeota archaeon]|nr:Snf7 family protein [Candidatus Bathyarchaeum sp.]
MKNPFRASPQFEKVVVEAVPKLKAQQYKLGQVIVKLTRRDKILFTTCATALQAKNKERAAIFATELAEVRKLTKVIYHTQILVERTILRLETLKEFNSAFSDLKPVITNLQSVTKSLSSFMPQMAVEMERVNESIFEVMTMSKIDSSKLEVPLDVKTEGGEEVLAEVAEFLEEQITEKLPEPPTSPVIQTPQRQPQQRVVQKRQMVALTATCSEISEPRISQKVVSFKETEMKRVALTINEDLEQSVLDYAKRRSGDLDIDQCATELQVACGEIEKALESLGVKGKIKIAS